MINGFDAAFDCRPVLPKIVAAGVPFVERYIGVGSPYKRLTLDEAVALRAAGIDIVSVVEEWSAETAAEQARFTFASGEQMAQAAMTDAVILRQPHGSGIYFAVDGDVLSAAITSNIVPFFRGIKAKFDAAQNPWRIGVYGSGLVGHTLLPAGLVELFQIANAHGWTDYSRYEGLAHLIQGATGSYGFGEGRMVDADVGVGDFGSWGQAAPGPRPVPAPQPAPETIAIPPARDLQAALVAAGAKIMIDGRWGKDSADALAAYYQRG